MLISLTAGLMGGHQQSRPTSLSAPQPAQLAVQRVAFTCLVRGSCVRAPLGQGGEHLFIQPLPAPLRPAAAKAS